jgi:hypothetical protein
VTIIIWDVNVTVMGIDPILWDVGIITWDANSLVWDVKTYGDHVRDRVASINLLLSSGVHLLECGLLV